MIELIISSKDKYGKHVRGKTVKQPLPHLSKSSLTIQKAKNTSSLKTLMTKIALHRTRLPLSWK